MFAVVETGGKQYSVKTGDVIAVEKIDGKVGEVITLDRVLFSDNTEGDALVRKQKLHAEILEQTRTDKVIIFKKKRRKDYQRKMGHRQYVTLLRIKDLV